MNLTDVIKVWDELHVKDTGELGYSDLEKAIEKVVGIRNNVPGGCCSLNTEKEVKEN